jgi:Zn-dependent metalloprotease
MKGVLNNLLFVLGMLFTVPVLAQPSLQKMQQKLAVEKQNTAQSFYRVEMLNKTKTQASVVFSADMMPQKAEVKGWLKENLELRSGIDLLMESTTITDYFGAAINKIQQYFKGIKVEHGVISQVSSSGKVQLLQMEFYSISDELSVSPVITEEAAFEIAKRHVAADKYSWDLNKHNDPGFAKHKADLVIVEDMIDEPGKMCLAYKCDIYAISPLSRDYIYVNAANGHIVFKDAIIRHAASDRFSAKKTATENPVNQPMHIEQRKTPVLKQSVVLQQGNRVMANATGWGNTRYSGKRYITTNLFQPNSYELTETGRGDNTAIETININNDSSTATSTAFVDTDNMWTTAEYDDPWFNNMALDIHWATEQIVDYWWKVHGRKSYDNANAKMHNLVHFKSDFDNAFWEGGAMWYGDGSFTPGKFKPLASIDVCGHEIGHAVCEKTAALVYARESGAVNEGFSDIWAACIDNYVKDTVTKKPFLIADEIMASTVALRSMADPHSFNDADTYLDTTFFWKKTSIEACPVPDGSETGNDFCGVHYNSGVLNKWFYLITNGGSGSNGNGDNYNVTGMGFTKTERIAFFTEQILTPNSGYGATRNASLNAVSILAASNSLGITYADTATITKAWRAVGVADSVFNEINTPIFDTSLFTAVAVGKYGYIWAGTANRGLYKFDGAVWQKAPVLLNHNIADIKTDKDGGIWIAQFGRTGAQALNGGIDYFPDSSFNFKQFSTSEGLATRNVRSLYIDNSAPADSNTTAIDTFKRVWAACFSDITGSVTRNGAAVRGLASPVTDTLKYFKKILNVPTQTITYCQTIAGSKNEVWVYASMNTPDTNRIIRYRTKDTAYLGSFDSSNSLFPKNFNVKAMYYDSVWKKWWVGMATGGVYIYNEQSPGWSHINFPTIFPAGTIVNNNAIIGDVRGNIYIGTNNGYIFCGDENATGPVNAYDSTQYKRFTNLDGLPANNVKALAIDYRAARLVIATDSGIIFKYTLCRDCINNAPSYTTAPGLWNNPGIWNTNRIPGLNTNVVVQHAITIPADASCNSIKIQAPGNITVTPGVNLKVNGVNYTATVH